MPVWTLKVPVDCVGIYQVTADTEEEAVAKFLENDGVECLHYSEEYPASDPTDIEITED